MRQACVALVALGLARAARAEDPRDSLTTINRCAALQTQRHPDRGFAADLRLLGPEGEGCLDASLADGKAGAYRLTYTPGPPSAEGKIRVYTICAEPLDTARIGSRVFASDESGAIHESRAGEASRPGGGGCAEAWEGDTRLLWAIKYCIVHYAARHDTAGYPASLELVGSSGTGCLRDRPPQVRIGLDVLWAPTYVYDYQAGPPEPPGRIATFRVHGRPTGWAGRTYFLDESGLLRVARGGTGTPGDRTLAESLEGARERPEPSPVAEALARGCKSGSSEDCFRLAVLHWNGRGVSQSFEQAGTFLEIACTAGHGKACTSLGELHEAAFGRERQWEQVPGDQLRAVTFYEKGCDLGQSDGCLKAAERFGSGSTEPPRARRVVVGSAPSDSPPREPRPPVTKGVVQDEARALRFYLRACDLGSTEGCLYAGTWHASGRGASKDAGAAVALYERACQAGDARGCGAVAGFYARGEGVARDVPRAARLYSSACGWLPYPCFDLGHLYARGEGLHRDLRRAIEAFERGCETERWRRPDQCTELDVLYREACAGGDPWSCSRLGQRPPTPRKSGLGRP